MLSMFVGRLRQAESRSLFAKILARKLIGAATVVALVSLVSSNVLTARAEDAAVAPAYINPMNTMWTLIAAFLVFFMQAGFMMLGGGGADQLIGQAIGSAAVTVASLGVGLLLMYLVKATGTLRVSKDGELQGLDIHEHGGPAYPELIGGVSGYALPMPKSVDEVLGIVPASAPVAS